MKIATCSRPLLITALALTLSASLAGQALGDPAAPKAPTSWAQLPLPPIPEINTMAWLDGWKGIAREDACAAADNVVSDDRMSGLRQPSRQWLIRDGARAS